MIQYPRYKRHRFSSFQVIIAGFAAVDLVGALLLMLPIACLLYTSVLHPPALFFGFPRPQLYPHGKRGCSAPGDPGTAGSSRPCTDQSGDAAHPYGNSDGAGRTLSGAAAHQLSLIHIFSTL